MSVGIFPASVVFDASRLARRSRKTRDMAPYKVR
jgi:hypothetical protein